MSILKSFEEFWSLPKKILDNKIFKVSHIETSAPTEVESPVQTEIDDNCIQFNVYNNQKVYSLLTSVLYKKKKLNENKIRKIS
ncbi:MAG: hypothetical protein K6C94_08680 [Candidatus Gastranaerophilales bacterium]|nr:hypothetical protein [Candidatus Gastranaerophilales bacterium]